MSASDYPIQKEEIVTLWDCGIETHRHKSKIRAISCVKQQGRHDKLRTNKMVRIAFQRKILVMALDGMKRSEIARAVGRSYTTVVAQLLNIQRHLYIYRRSSLRLQSDTGDWIADMSLDHMRTHKEIFLAAFDSLKKDELNRI